MNREQRRAQRKQRTAPTTSVPEGTTPFATALRHYQAGDLDEAERLCRRILAHDPHGADSLNLLGVVVARRTGRHDLAAAMIRQAITIDATAASYHSNLGNLLMEQGRLDEAAACYRTAIALQPHFSESHNNLGNVLKAQRRLDEAATCYRAALAFRPDFPDARYNLGVASLTRGNLAAGWKDYEWRWRTPDLIDACRGFAQPQWRGDAAMGRTLLIHAEQDFGDTLQFCRYAPLAAVRGLKVILEMQPPLVRLLHSLPGIDRVLARGEFLPDFDLHCPMLSLPLALETTLATIPGTTPYLRADVAEVVAWWARLAVLPARGPRVGLVWAGSARAHAPTLAAVDRRRSLAPDRLASLVDLPGLHFLSLQKGGPEKPADFVMTDFMEGWRTLSPRRR